MTIRHLYPAVEPSLNLDFANSKKLDSRITFTRGSTATYTDESGIIRTAAQDEARFDHDGDGNSLGLLIEESRTNLVTYSEDYSQSSWTLDDCTIQSTSVLTPDGQTALLLRESATTQTHNIRQSPSTSTGTTYTASVFLKKYTRQYAWIGYVFNSAAGTVAQIDLNTGQIVYSAKIYATDSIQSTSVIPYPNGWYKVTITFTNGLVSPNISVGTADSLWTSGNADGNQFLGDTNEGLYIWGAQLEAGSFPTSYIPTSGSTVTRSADVTSMTGTNFSSWYNQSEGTVFYQGIMPYANVSGYPSIYRIGVSGQNSNEIDLLRNPGGKRLNINVHSGGSTVYAVDVNPLPDNYKVAVGYETDNFNAASSGTLTGLDTSGAAPVGADRFLIDHANTRHHISRLTYYPVRLPDATLQALTL